MATDPIAALASFLRHQVGSMLTILPGGIDRLPAGLPAVFRPDMPMAFETLMPTACIVLRPAGGYKQFGKSQLYIGDPQVDVVCYAATQQEATQIAQAVVVQCKQLVAQQWENTLLYAAHIVGGPVPLPDTQTLWPTCWTGVQLVHGELPLHA